MLYYINLLIEPVWNRNHSHSPLFYEDVLLLIEPVWNRNYADPLGTCHPKLPFNRTSMESKLGIDFIAEVADGSFNRTSMESKLISYPPKIDF